MSADESKGESTRLVHVGRSPERFGGAVNPPITRASTLLSPTADGLYNTPKSLYGRMGTDVHQVLCEGLGALEGADYVKLAPNGLSACSLALGATISAGDHILVTDSAYGPTQRFSERYLKRMGVEATFFHPRLTGDELDALIKPNTKLIFLEMPGSMTFELHDLKEILPVCKARNIITVLDNTWAAGVFLKPLDMGIDIVVQALTKYVIGHSDGFGGAVMTNEQRIASQVEATSQDWGISMSPDDAYLAQRGLRTLTTRISAQGRSALEIAQWLAVHPKIRGVYHPALPNHPDHEIFLRDFSGSSGLFGFTLDTTDKEALDRFFDQLELFGFGFSWGGFESLMNSM